MSVTDELAAEQRVLREGCALVDRSERGKLALTGTEAKELLQGQLTNDVEALAPGDGCYAALLTHKGRMLADVRVLDAGDELWLDTERVGLTVLFNTLRRALIGRDVTLHKRTLECGLLSLIGPESRGVADADALPLAEHANRRGELAGIPVLRVATDVGVDVICPAEAVPAVRAALEARGAIPLGEAAAEVLRVERGRPRLGVDLDEATIPQEAGLNERAVSFTKGCYVGQETVARLHYKGKPNRHLRGLRLTGPAEPGEVLRLGEREVGRLGSVVHSPELGPIALALVRREAAPGDTVAVGEAGLPAEVVALPFAPATPR